MALNTLPSEGLTAARRTAAAVSLRVMKLLISQSDIKLYLAISEIFKNIDYVIS